MQNAEAGDAAVPSTDQHDSFYLIVSDLVSLIDHVQASIGLIEAAAAQDCTGNQESAEIVILDDVTPLYTQAGAALGACNTSLSAALRFLIETKSLPACAGDGLTRRAGGFRHLRGTSNHPAHSTRKPAPPAPCQACNIVRRATSHRHRTSCRTAFSYSYP